MEGRLIVLSGFSGVGKGTVLKHMMAAHPGEFRFSISGTTRNPRQGETDGVDYFFMTNPDFEKLIQEDQLIEYTQYQNCYYGTPKSSVFPYTEKGIHVIFDIEVEGALNIQKKYPKAQLIYMIPPTAGDLINRLVGRGTESDEKIRGRLKRAKEESAIAEQYDALIINDSVEACSERLYRLIMNPSMGAELKETGIPVLRQVARVLNILL